MSFYHDLIIDHYQNPRNFGELKNPDATAREVNASCGDMVEIQIKIKKGVSLPRQGDSLIEKIAWRGVGCAISTAAASLLSQRVKSEKFKVKSLLQMAEEDMVEMLGGDISHARIKCATLPLVALQKAIHQLSEKSAQIG